MAEEKEILEEGQEDVQLDEQDDVQQENKVEKRIQQLSNKVKLTSRERDELATLNKEKDAKLATAQKEVEFYSSFSDTTDKYPAAKEYKDKIKEKVLLGYSVEDAAVAILAKEGKLNAVRATENPAGGSATNPPISGEPKPLQDMNLQEKRAEVLKAMERGDISLT